MRYFFLTLLFLTTASLSAENWTPPSKPSPQRILEEAESDRTAKNYETSLAKYVWIHEKSLSIQPAFVGVRLSFALMGWHKLAQEYPPAMKKLEEFRDKATDAFNQDKSDHESFSVLAAINRTLNQSDKTKDLFVELDRKEPKIAQQVFMHAKNTLLNAKEYKLYAKYFDPKTDLSQAIMVRNLTKPKAEKDPANESLRELHNKMFTTDVTTLIAILVVNDRKDEAAEIAKTARKEWDDKTFDKAIDDALKGNVPQQLY